MKKIIIWMHCIMCVYIYGRYLHFAKIMFEKKVNCKQLLICRPNAMHFMYEQLYAAVWKLI